MFEREIELREREIRRERENDRKTDRQKREGDDQEYL